MEGRARSGNNRLLRLRRRVLEVVEVELLSASRSATSFNLDPLHPRTLTTRVSDPSTVSTPRTKEDSQTDVVLELSQDRPLPPLLLLRRNERNVSEQLLPFLSSRALVPFPFTYSISSFFLPGKFSLASLRTHHNTHAEEPGEASCSAGVPVGWRRKRTRSDWGENEGFELVR